MKHLYLNLKRFDIPPAFGGVNRIAPASEWSSVIIKSTQEALKAYSAAETDFVQFFPEAHIIPAAAARSKGSPVRIGCQAVYRMDTAPGGNFGALTTQRPASIMKELGCDATIIGHCEERNDKNGILAEAGAMNPKAINRLLNQEIKCALERDMDVLYCIGEKSEEQNCWQEVLRDQLETGLSGVNMRRIVIGYEPVWSIGPGKTPAGREYIEKIARFIKEVTGGADVVYGGGLKADNAKMLASIPEIDGGLIALTRFSGEIGFYPDEYLEIISLYLDTVS
jgi:triosephosphate isomerase